MDDALISLLLEVWERLTRKFLDSNPRCEMALSNKSEFTGITGRMPEIVHGVDY
jgi:hypothetical protein